MREVLVSNKPKHNISDYFEAGLYILAFFCFVHFLIIGNMQKTLQPVFISMLLISIKALINRTKIEVSSSLRLFILIFIFVAMFLAVEFNFYSIIPGLDKIEHLFSGILFVFIGFLIFKNINKKTLKIQVHPLTIVFFCMFFSIAVAGCWEIYEFTMDRLFGLNCQNGSLMDTMGDIICGTTGAILTSIYLNYRIKKHDKRFSLK
jgi:uncharacterized membrane protein YjdF